MKRSLRYGVHLCMELNHADIRARRAFGPRHASALALAFECWNYEWRTKIVPAFIALFGFGWSALADDASLPALPRSPKVRNQTRRVQILGAAL
jgi:hypothetical protein